MVLVVVPVVVVVAVVVVVVPVDAGLRKVMDANATVNPPNERHDAAPPPRPKVS